MPTYVLAHWLDGMNLLVDPCFGGVGCLGGCYYGSGCLGTLGGGGASIMTGMAGINDTLPSIFFGMVGLSMRLLILRAS